MKKYYIESLDHDLKSDRIEVNGLISGAVPNMLTKSS